MAGPGKRRATYQDVLDAPEVLSPSNERLDRTEKLPLYASLGVKHAWLVHPRFRTVDAFRLHERQWLAIAVHREQDRARIEPLDAIELDVGALWANLPLPTRASDAAWWAAL